MGEVKLDEACRTRNRRPVDQSHVEDEALPPVSARIPEFVGRGKNLSQVQGDGDVARRLRRDTQPSEETVKVHRSEAGYMRVA
jgi:hypothetical protein